MDFYYPLLSLSSKDLISCLTCLFFLKFSWWLVWTFSTQTQLNFQINVLKVINWKENKRILVVHQKISIIFHSPSAHGQNISWPLRKSSEPLLHPRFSVPNRNYPWLLDHSVCQHNLTIIFKEKLFGSFVFIFENSQMSFAFCGSAITNPCFDNHIKYHQFT